MKVLGIITEYNPFHYGHQYHLDEAIKLSQADIVINVMSGNFVQRGEPAIIDKYQRAKQAIEAGCDIVFELHYIYATQAATKFSYGSVEVLKLAQATNLIFGSESANLKQLQNFATSAKIELNKSLSTNQNYQLIRGETRSNDILGINYLKALTNSNIKVDLVKRTNNYQDEHLAKISSASAIRKAVYNKQAYEHTTPMHNLDSKFQIANYYRYLQYLLINQDSQYLSTLFLMDEGIENHLRKQALICNTYEEFLAKAITKKYPKAKIQRTLIQLLNNITKQEANELEAINYLRVLAFNDKGQTYLKHLKQQGIKVVTRFKDLSELDKQVYLRTAYNYGLVSDNPSTYVQLEVQAPLRITK